jgi:hypothetical protein
LGFLFLAETLVLGFLAVKVQTSGFEGSEGLAGLEEKSPGEGSQKRAVGEEILLSLGVQQLFAEVVVVEGSALLALFGASKLPLEERAPLLKGQREQREGEVCCPLGSSPLRAFL